MSWNCQGLGNSLTVRRLRELRLKSFPDVMFLMDTKNQDNVVFHVLQWMGYANKFTVPPTGLSGGLALLWKDDVDLQILDSSPNFIDTKLTSASASFHYTFVYGEPALEHRLHLWNKLSNLGVSRDSTWILSGDFNEIVDNNEKRRGVTRSEKSFVHFRSFITRNGLLDVKHTGNYLSWRGKRHSHFVRARLDRSLANNSWFEMFPSGRLQYFRFEGSDHRPVLTFLNFCKKKKLFTLDDRLREKEEIFQLISEIWPNPNDRTVANKLASCRRELINWTREQGTISAQLISEAQAKLEMILSSDPPDDAEKYRLNTILENADKDEETFWKQRSRVLWLQCGDKNTKFFYAITRNRRSINRFTVLEDNNGLPHHREQDFSKIISDYFRDSFASQSQGDFSILEEVLSPCISLEDNNFLTALPSIEEIKQATFDINAGKAPGADGFTSGFFQSYWSIIGEDVTREVQAFFISSCFPPMLNVTHIRLIPKILSPKKVSDYRPIALCYVF